MASRAAERCVGLYTSSLLTCRRCGGRGEEGQVRGKGQAQGGGRRDAAGVDPPGLQRPSVPAAHQIITDQAPVTTTTTTTTHPPFPASSSPPTRSTASAGMRLEKILAQGCALICGNLNSV